VLVLFLASSKPINEKLTPHLQLTGKERALMLSIDMHAFDKILPSIGRLL